jgi:uncharacterized membrane protein YraQ (UPF0718 family)
VERIWNLLERVGADVIGTFAAVWPYLLVSVIAAVVVSVYVGPDRISRLLARRSRAATSAAVLLATLTPFCSCGTTAVLLGMMATAAPWAPLVAFMIASPLTSPSELVFSAGLFGWPFALLFFGGTILLGLAAGGVAHTLDRAGWLRDQARVRPERRACPGSECTVTEPAAAYGPGTASTAEFPTRRQRWKIPELLDTTRTVGGRLLVFLLGFTAVGYLAIEAIPTAWLTDHLGDGSALAVPLAALLGVPAYVNTEASLPLVAAMMAGGMGPGPAMAFLVTGAGTSIGAITQRGNIPSCYGVRQPTVKQQSGAAAPLRGQFAG